MPPGFSGNLIFAIIARMLCGNHLNFGGLTKPGCPSLEILVKLLNQQVRRNDVCNRNYKQ